MTVTPVTPESVEAIRAEMIATIEGNIQNIKDAQDSIENALLGTGWIVRNPEGNVCMTYTVSNGVANEPRPVSVYRATRFCEVDARAIAAQTFNGNKTPAHAVHIRVALAEALAENQQTLEFLKNRKV